MGLQRIALIALLLAGFTSASADEKETRKSFSFAVLGHVRGNDDGLPSPMLDQLLAKVKRQNPDMIVLTGDMIWGGLGKQLQRQEIIIQDWERLDSALAKLNIPVYRVAGNHDLHNSMTRDIYFARYGKLPQAFSYYNSRFLLLNSTYVPGVDAVMKSELARNRQPFLRGKQLGSEQIEFIRREISTEKQYDHFFLFMHHLLWWHEDEERWWREVHPVIAGRVRAVFAGDVGPRKFSHLKRDGVDYIQSSIADIPMENLRRHWQHRMIAQQFDNYLHVTVNGAHVDIEVETIGELLSGQFTPQSWREMHRPEPPEVKTLQARIRDYTWELIGNTGSPRRQMAAFLSAMIICFFGGVVVALLWHRWKVA